MVHALLELTDTNRYGLVTRIERHEGLAPEWAFSSPLLRLGAALNRESRLLRRLDEHVGRNESTLPPRVDILVEGDWAVHERPDRWVRFLDPLRGSLRQARGRRRHLTASPLFLATRTFGNRSGLTAGTAWARLGRC